MLPQWFWWVDAHTGPVAEVVGPVFSAVRDSGVIGTADGVGVPQIVVVGVGIVGLVALAIAIRGAVQSEPDDKPYSYEPPGRSNEEKNGSRSSQQPGPPTDMTSEPDSTDSIASRRNVLVGGAGLVAAIGAGVALSEQTTAGPEETAATFVGAIGNGNFDRADSMIHPDSPLGGAGEAVDLIIDFAGVSVAVDAVDISAEGSQVTRNGDEQAVVEVTAGIDVIGRDVTSVDVPLEMRTANGDWYVWNIDL